jgi:hypothetical protein
MRVADVKRLRRPAWSWLSLAVGLLGTVAATLPSQDGLTPEPLDQVMHYTSSVGLADPVTSLQK